MLEATDPPTLIVPATASAAELASALRWALSQGQVVIVADDVDAAHAHAASLANALHAPAAATASPVPLPGSTAPTAYVQSSALPPAASLSVPCVALCAIRPEAAASVAWEPTGLTSARHALQVLAEVLHHHGWRHVTAPGVAMAWDPTDAAGIHPVAGWTASAVAALAGPANSALEAHVSWASSRIDHLRVVVDGACMTSTPYTGTQHVVLEISRWLARTRPTSTIVLAAPTAALPELRRALAGERVEVAERKLGIAADVLYRPYQMLYAAELPFVLATGRRGLIGQLDMIGFSNPAYHPSEQLLFFARNLQRHLMRVLDGVTFISKFGRDTAYAECPDLDTNRLHVVSCGADPDPQNGAIDPGRGIDRTTPFVSCLSSTFWHKNRAHAIRTFAELVARHGYQGHLVIAGPEPYFGRSIAAEDQLLADLPTEVANRVHRWGQIAEREKWWLLRHSQLTLYPSVIEGFGLVPFEAAAVGTPCLVPAQTATDELLGTTGATVASWDPVAWAERAHSMIASPDQSRALVDEVTTIASQHTWEACARATWRAIDDTLARPRRSLHVDDGGALTRIAGDRLTPAARVRFHLVRGLPALRRRAQRIISRNRPSGDA